MGTMQKLKMLATDIGLLSSLGEVITLQIDLQNVSAVASALEQEFNDSRGEGRFIENSILIEIQESKFYNFETILKKILTITGDFESIDGVTALIRIPIGNDKVEVTVELSGASSPPQILATADSSTYFDVIRVIQAKWSLARGRMV